MAYNDDAIYEMEEELDAVKQELREIGDALGDYLCSMDDMSSAVRRLVSAYKERNETAAAFAKELCAVEIERDALRATLCELREWSGASGDESIQVAVERTCRW